MSQRLDTLRARRTARCESGRRAAASSAKNHPACSLPVLRQAGRPRLLLPAPLTACCWATLLEACFQKRCPAACSAAAHSPARQVPRVVPGPWWTDYSGPPLFVAVYSRTLALLFVGLQTSHGTHKGGWRSRGATRAPHEGEREASVVVPCTRRARAALLPALACHCRLRALRVLRRWSRGGRAGEARACACGSGWATRAMRVRSAVFSTCTSVESGSMCTHTHTLAPPLSFSARTHARTRASTHTHTCMRLTRPRTRTRAHARTHALTHLRTRAHTHARSAAVVLLHQAGPRGAGGAARCARGRGTGPGSGRQRGGREARGAEARLTQARG